MTTTVIRRGPAADGQLAGELWSRDLSGFPFRSFTQLARLLDDIGQPCCATGPTAAALHRFDQFVLKPPFHVLTPRTRNVRRIGHEIHTSIEVPLIDLATVAGIRTVSPARALIELAADLSPAKLTVALDSALRDGKVSEDFLHRRIAALRSSGRYGIPKLLAVIDGCEITRGGHSWLEREVLRLLAEALLPRPQTQQVLSRTRDRLIRVDFRFPDTPVVVEALGYRWHRSAGAMGVDTQRLNRLILDGFVPLQFTYDRIAADGEGAIAEVAEALRPYR